jgi:hypothetical protein
MQREAADDLEYQMRLLNSADDFRLTISSEKSPAPPHLPRMPFLLINRPAMSVFEQTGYCG